MLVILFPLNILLSELSCTQTPLVVLVILFPINLLPVPVYISTPFNFPTMIFPANVLSFEPEYTITPEREGFFVVILFPIKLLLELENK